MSTKRVAPKRLITTLEIAQRVRHRREFLGIKREEMAQLIGVGYTGYSHKETGEREISNQELMLIAQRLDVSAAYLLGEEEAEDLRRHEIVRFFDGLPVSIQQAELEHMRALHRAHVKETGPRIIGGHTEERGDEDSTEIDR